MSLIQKIRRRGILYSFAMVVYRIIPAWLFRFTVMDILEIDWDIVSQSTFGYRESLREMNSIEEREQLRELTMAGSVNCESEFPLGFGILDQTQQHLIGGLWIGEKEHYEPSFGFKFLLPKNAGWLFAAQLRKEFRGKGDYNELLAFSLRKTLEHGRSPVFLAVSPCHHAAVYSHGKFSHKAIGRVYGIRFLKFSWVACRGSLSIERSVSFRCEEEPGEIRILEVDRSQQRSDEAVPALV